MLLLLVFLVICVSCANCHVCSLQPNGDLSGPPSSLVCCDLLCFVEYCIVFRILFFSVSCSLIVTCCEGAGLWAVMYVVLIVILSLSYLISWVRCGA